jgi:hypothetical protein
MMDELTNECQKLAIEIFAQNGASNSPSTIIAAQLIGEAFADKIREREAKGEDSLSRNYAREKMGKIISGYQESERGVFEDIWSVLRQDSFLFRSLVFIASSELTVGEIQTAFLKSLNTWVLAWSQHKGLPK